MIASTWTICTLCYRVSVLVAGEPCALCRPAATSRVVVAASRIRGVWRVRLDWRAFADAREGDVVEWRMPLVRACAERRTKEEAT